MAERGWGRVVTIGSVQQERPHPALFVYAGTKPPQFNWVPRLARQFGGQGVTVNKLAAGVILTARNRDQMAVEGETEVQRTSAGHLCRADGLVGAAMLLCSDVGRYINGANLFVDGGRTAVRCASSHPPRSGAALLCPKEPKREQWLFHGAHRMHDVRRIVDKATDARLVPWIVRLAPFPARHHDIDLLGRMAVVRISRMRRHKTHADPDIAPYLDPLRTGDCRVGVAVQELLALRLGARPDLPVELRLDDGKGIGQGADRTWLTARVLQRRRQMAADRQPSRSRPLGLDGRRPERCEHLSGSNTLASVGTGAMADRCIGQSEKQLEIGGTVRRHLGDPQPAVDILAHRSLLVASP
jgi:hypothetical protein